MRVTCESCGANYNLPDSKVRGRKAKVRCKRCAGTIVVDGTALDPSSPNQDSGDEGVEDEEATAVMQSPLSGLGARAAAVDEWTVNLTDDDQKTMTTKQLVDGWFAGSVTDDAFVWKDGMSDWQPVLEVPELAQAIRAAEASRPKAAAAPVARAGGGMSIGQIGVVQRPASEAIRGNSGPARPLGQSMGGAAAAKPRPATFDLFGPPRSLERDSQPHASAGPFAHESHANPVGASSENSVVFSLESLKAAAGKNESRAADSRASEDLLTMGGFDPIASPMSAPLIEVIPTRPPPADPALGFGSRPAPAFAAPAVVAPPPKKTSIWVWVGVGAVVLGGGFFGGRMLTQPPAGDPATAGSGRAGSVDTTAAADEAKKAEEAKKADEAKAAEAKKAEEEKAAAEAKAAEEAKATGGGAKPGTPSGGGGGGTPKPTTGGGGGDKPETPKPSSGGGGKAFDVGAAKSALAAAAGQVSSCKSGDGPTGAGKVQVTFAPSGRVTNARVISGPFGGTTVGGCVARTFRGAKVPAFDGDPVTVAKSFNI